MKPLVSILIPGIGLPIQSGQRLRKIGREKK